MDEERVKEALETLAGKKETFDEVLAELESTYWLYNPGSIAVRLREAHNREITEITRIATSALAALGDVQPVPEKNAEVFEKAAKYFRSKGDWQLECFVDAQRWPESAWVPM